MIELALPWLHKELSPNARVHWGKRAKLIKHARTYAGVAVLVCEPKDVVEALKQASKFDVYISFYPPDKRKRDMDNMVSNATMKAYLDGIAGALGVDDSTFTLHYSLCEVVKGGTVLIQICARDV